MEDEDIWEPPIEYKGLSYDIHDVCARLCNDAYVLNTMLGYNMDGTAIGTKLYKYGVTLLYEKLKDIYGENSELFYNRLTIAREFSSTLMCSRDEMLLMLDDSNLGSKKWAESIAALHPALDVPKRISEIDEIISNAIESING